MSPGTINLINAIVLIAMGLWGYLSSETPSPTSLIPVGFGVVFLALTPGMRKENKVVAHIVVLLTLLIIVALAAKPLPAAIGRADNMAVFRIGAMVAVSVVALIVYIKSFIDARKART